MSFQGWPAEALDFYEGLEADNSKTYWTEHKAVYEENVRRPMADLVEELAPEFGEPKIFRPYRDLRFSPDKSPYKTNIAAVVGDGYITLSAEGLGVGSGIWMMAREQLEAYRRAVAEDETGGELQRIIAAIEEQGIGVHGHEVLKTAPRGYPADHPRAGLLRYKGVTAWKRWPVEPWLGTPAARDRVAGVLSASRPLCRWLEENAGPAAGNGRG